MYGPPPVRPMQGRTSFCKTVRCRGFGFEAADFTDGGVVGESETVPNKVAAQSAGVSAASLALGIFFHGLEDDFSFPGLGREFSPAGYNRTRKFS
jgi:hypothetical protein